MVRLVAKGDSYEEVENVPLKNGSFEDMMENGVNAHTTCSTRFTTWLFWAVLDFGESGIKQHR